MPIAPKQFRLYPQAKRQEKSPEAFARARKYRTKGWEIIRQRILARDGMQCQLCGDLCIGKGQAHVDHIKAVVDGGSDEDANLQTLCSGCHSRKTLRHNHG